MKRTNFSFSFKELVFFIFKIKRCPNCHSKELKRYTIKGYNGIGKSTIRRMNLGTRTEIFEGIFIYECKSCRCQYTLDGLMNNIEVKEDFISEFNINHSQLCKNKKNINSKQKFIVKYFFNFVVLTMFFILLFVAIKERNMLLILIFGPIILGYYGIIRILTKQ